MAFQLVAGGEDWTNPVLYEMVLNSARVGREKCVSVIVDYIQIKYGEVEDLKHNK